MKTTKAAKVLKELGLAIGDRVAYDVDGWVGMHKTVRETRHARITGVGESCIVIRHKGAAETVMHVSHVRLHDLRLAKPAAERQGEGG